jgi:hypothetical protein
VNGSPDRTPSGGPSEQVVDLRAHEEVAEAFVGHVDVRHDGELLDEGAVALLDVGGPGLGLPLASDVDDQADPVRGPALGRLDVDGLVPDPDDATSREEEAVFLEVRSQGRVSRDITQLHALAVVGMDERVPEVAGSREPLRRVAGQLLDPWAHVRGPTRRSLRLHVRHAGHRAQDVMEAQVLDRGVARV